MLQLNKILKAFICDYIQPIHEGDILESMEYFPFPITKKNSSNTSYANNIQKINS